MSPQKTYNCPPDRSPCFGDCPDDSTRRWQNGTGGWRVQGNFLHLLGVAAAAPKPPLAELNGFLLAASWLGFPPRPLKKPPPRPALPEPNTPLLDDEAGCKTKGQEMGQEERLAGSGQPRPLSPAPGPREAARAVPDRTCLHPDPKFSS